MFHENLGFHLNQGLSEVCQNLIDSGDNVFARLDTGDDTEYHTHDTIRPANIVINMVSELVFGSHVVKERLFHHGHEQINQDTLPEFVISDLHIKFHGSVGVVLFL